MVTQQSGQHVVPLPTHLRINGRQSIAATIERWIAQLVSELDYDELLIFFLTYCTYISAVDLWDLLIFGRYQ
ncbi:hypothetical protein K503DRAFT_870097 [Rhizopogon vinicolor AM-OR11-026]|uniref:N-terminal Ras-GEF domain-containing protein n=1 Tax=Rhizopogon vinicolor AM-OR11-026 TaxID=1314800 RepID=A0A1B7MIW7_9AGAM|nr:hypothetical protein K503DRAFT_870097 [Rhizopogon vinicolor AM-OR11-026]